LSVTFRSGRAFFLAVLFCVGELMTACSFLRTLLYTTVAGEGGGLYSATGSIFRITLFFIKNINIFA
jgi:hypothetical protein